MSDSGGTTVYKLDCLTQEEIDNFDMQPLMFRIVVKEFDYEKVGMIYIPDESKEKRVCEGWVIAKGPDVDLVSIGDRVSYGQYSGAILKRGKNKYLVMNEKDVLGVIKSPKEVRSNG